MGARKGGKRKHLSDDQSAAERKEILKCSKRTDDWKHQSAEHQQDQADLKLSDPAPIGGMPKKPASSSQEVQSCDAECCVAKYDTTETEGEAKICNAKTTSNDNSPDGMLKNAAKDINDKQKEDYETENDHSHPIPLLSEGIETSTKQPSVEKKTTVQVENINPEMEKASVKSQCNTKLDADNKQDKMGTEYTSNVQDNKSNESVCSNMDYQVETVAEFRSTSNQPEKEHMGTVNPNDVECNNQPETSQRSSEDIERGDKNENKQAVLKYQTDVKTMESFKSPLDSTCKESVKITEEDDSVKEIKQTDRTDTETSASISSTNDQILKNNGFDGSQPLSDQNSHNHGEQNKNNTVNVGSSSSSSLNVKFPTEENTVKMIASTKGKTAQATGDSIQMEILINSIIKHQCSQSDLKEEDQQKCSKLSAEDSAFDDGDGNAFEMDVTESQLCAVSDDVLGGLEYHPDKATEAKNKEQRDADKIVNNVLETLLNINDMVMKTRQEMETLRKQTIGKRGAYALMTCQSAND